MFHPVFTNNAESFTATAKGEWQCSARDRCCILMPHAKNGLVLALNSFAILDGQISCHSVTFPLDGLGCSAAQAADAHFQHRQPIVSGTGASICVKHAISDLFSVMYLVLVMLFCFHPLHTSRLRYMATMLSKLRQYQRQGGIPDFQSFCKEAMRAVENPGPRASLKQRLDLLRQFVEESEVCVQTPTTGQGSGHNIIPV